MKGQINKYKIQNEFEHAYVVAMMQIIARGLVSASCVDEEIRTEFSIFPKGYQIQMMVLPNGPSFTLVLDGNGYAELCQTPKAKPDLSIKFKHISLAFQVFSFQESTARAFANDRMIADGELSHAIRLVRCLNKMEALILPKAIALKAVKQYPALGLVDKIKKSSRIYGLIAQHAVLGK